jgi:hypothetical protein
MAIPDDGAIVYVPARPYRRDVAFEVRHLPDGRKLGIAFTSLDMLVEVLGQYQPWVALRVTDLRASLGEQGVTAIMFDPPVPEEGWRWTADRFTKYTGVE